MADNEFTDLLRNHGGDYALANTPDWKYKTTWEAVVNHRNNKGLNEDYLAKSGVVPVADLTLAERLFMFKAGIYEGYGHDVPSRTFLARDIKGDYSNYSEEFKRGLAFALNTFDDENAGSEGGYEYSARGIREGDGSMKNAIGMGAAYLLYKSDDRLKGGGFLSNNTTTDLVSYVSDRGALRHRLSTSGHGGRAQWGEYSGDGQIKYDNEYNALHTISKKRADELVKMAARGVFDEDPYVKNLMSNMDKIYSRLQEEQVWSWATGKPIEDSALAYFMKHGELPEQTRYVPGYEGENALSDAVHDIKEGKLTRDKAKELLAEMEAGRTGVVNQPSSMVSDLYDPPPDGNEVSGAAETGVAGDIGDKIDENPLGVADDVQTPMPPAQARQAASHVSPDSTLPETQELHRNGARANVPHVDTRTPEDAAAALNESHEAARRLGEHAKGADGSIPSATSAEADKEFREVWDKMGMPRRTDEEYDKKWEEMTAHLRDKSNGNG